MATVIISAILVAYLGFVVYNRRNKKNCCGGGCDKCPKTHENQRIL